MRIRWFGESWDAPVCDEAYRIEAPIGKVCVSCHEPFEEGDRGLATAAIGELFGADEFAGSVFYVEHQSGGRGQYVRTAVGYHLDCFAAMVGVRIPRG